VEQYFKFCFGKGTEFFTGDDKIDKIMKLDGVPGGKLSEKGGHECI
jgi:hypothetical protein